MSVCCSASVYGISETNVLVVYNSESTDSQAVYNYYLTKRPNVRGFDLADASIITATVSYADYAFKIRSPIRNHLGLNNLEQIVQVIVLTKDIPHRIQSLDLNNLNVGDNANDTIAAYYAGNATCASVDSELTLLQFDLETGEAGDDYDSFADNAVINPYFDQTSQFSSYNRSKIDDAYNTLIRFSGYGWWRLYETFGRDSFIDAGNIYLTARLDADTLDDVKAMIDRAQNIVFRKDIDALLLDSDGQNLQVYAPPLNSSTTIDDYAEVVSTLSADWAQLKWNNNSSFLTGNSTPISYTPTIKIKGPVAHLHSYGVNHTGSNSSIRDYLATFNGQLVNGASFSAYESFGARGLGGLSNFGQAQVEEWISAGGTFATGPVWEPFTLGISRSEIFLDRFLNQGFTYVEAAWASILQLSWQTVVLGDPLATATVTTGSPYDQWIFSNTGVTPNINGSATFDTDLDLDGLSNGIEYLLDLDPGNSDTNSQNLPKLLIEDGDQFFIFTLADPVPTEATVSVEMSTTLAANDWTTIATRSQAGTWSGSATVLEANTVNGKEIEITDNLVITTSNRFYRISAIFAP
jgi:uncharacterized protein (TIGR03790 family)